MDPIQILAIIFGLAICAFPFVYVIHSIRTGTAIALGWHVHRAENPRKFWLYLGFVALLGFYFTGKLAYALGEVFGGL